MKHDFSTILKNKKFKVTPARVAILEVFSKECKPVNAEEIFDSVKDTKIDQVTVYRTLNSFEETGILKRVDLRKGSAYYELNSAQHHHHIVCTICGTIEGFDMCSVEKISKEVLNTSKKFKTISDHSLELFGSCTKCSK
ncbi:MAG: transcriptional repressor [Patescibacteria group bacterium]